MVLFCYVVDVDVVVVCMVVVDECLVYIGCNVIGLVDGDLVM